MKELNLKGQIEIILEDENGQVKHREVKENTITQCALKQMLYNMMASGGLNTITRATLGASMTGVGTPSRFGIYVMSTPVEIKKDTFRPPYVDDNGTGLHPDVTFYNLNGEGSETSKCMIPVDSKCYFDKGSEIKFTLEYIKNSYTGIIRSVVIGRSHNEKNYNYQVMTKDVDLPSDWYTESASYLMEHTTDGTILYRTVNAQTQFSANLKTKLFTSYADERLHNNITTYFGGLIMNGTIFKASKASSSGSSYKVALQYVRDWKYTNTVATLEIPFTAHEGMVANSVVTPVLVANLEQNKLEVFVTTSIGNHNGIMGANVQKAVIDISNLDKITYSIVDMGIIPYSISGYGTTIGQYYTGFFHEGKYYLPFYHRVDSKTGKLSNQTDAYFQEGVILSSDFKTIHNTTCYRIAQNVFYAFVQADEILQCIVNTSTPYYITLSQVLSGTNLETPITKGANDILRVLYRYKLS